MRTPHDRHQRSATPEPAKGRSTELSIGQRRSAAASAPTSHGSDRFTVGFTALSGAMNVYGRMNRPRRTAALPSGIVAALLLMLCGHYAQAAAPPTPAQVVDVDSFWLTVANLDRSLAFYRNVVGLPLQSSDTPAADAMLRDLTAIPGARVRSATLRFGTGPSLRLLEFGSVRRRTLHPHSVDPGAAVLEVSVTDLASVLAAAARMHAPIVTPGGAPLSLPDGTRSVVLQDPDGFFVALSQPAPSPAAAAARSAARSLSMRYTVAAPATMVRFYRQNFGITLRTGPFGSPGRWTQLLNEPSAQWSVTQATADGAPADVQDLRDVQFVAFRHVVRHTYSGRPQDPGTSILSLRVSSLPAALRSIRSAGLRVLSAGGQPVPLPARGAAVLFRDPAGVLVELTQR
jgi:catechol 2,3-dioxygenase-like lactoylglutathione lyase family enzyme